MSHAILLILWLSMGTTSLVFTLTDDPPLTPWKVALAYTLGPVVIAIGALILLVAAIEGRQ